MQTKKQGKPAWKWGWSWSADVWYKSMVQKLTLILDLAFWWIEYKLLEPIVQIFTMLRHQALALLWIESLAYQSPDQECRCHMVYTWLYHMCKLHLLKHCLTLVSLAN